MNIPKRAIELAIADGWKPINFTNHPEYDYVIEGNMAYWQHVALDPTFWQALGKALGWSTPEKPNNVRDWLGRAHDFSDLILQGKDTKPFWDELLTKQ